MFNILHPYRVQAFFIDMELEMMDCNYNTSRQNSTIIASGRYTVPHY